MIQMNFRKFLIAISLVIIAVIPALAQKDSVSLATIVSKIDKYGNDNPIEKVYLNFDKPYYNIGDTIWFKAYLTIGPKHQLSALSNVIYVDITNSQDSLVRSIKLPAVNGMANGDIILAQASFKKGNYHIAAYTNWMRNSSPDYFFYKTISIGSAMDNVVVPKISIVKTQKNNEAMIDTRLQYKDIAGNPYPEKRVTWRVVNDLETIAKGKTNTDKDGFLNITFASKQLAGSKTGYIIAVIDLGNKKYVTNTFPLNQVLLTNDIQFFAEGGELIEGVRSKVAFKAIKSDGLGVNVTGTIVDNDGNEVSGFASQHAGMGIFALQPESGKTYKANVVFADGSKAAFDLPRIRSTGINLAVNNTDPENLSIKIATNAAYFQKFQNKAYYIVAQSGGTTYYTGQAALQSQVYTAAIPKNKFPTGVLQVTLFSSEGHPLSERIVFIQHNDQLAIAASTNLPVYTARQLVKMTVSAKNKALPVEGSFSVAVVDESKVPYDENAETTILSSLLLSSDLKGYIEKPNYYFGSDAKAAANLDILMLTQGYRRFSYRDVLTGKYPTLSFLPEHGMQITGTLRMLTGLPVYKGSVNLQVPDKNLSVNVTTDPVGQFKFSNLMINEPSKVIVSARNNTGYNNMSITLDLPSLEPVKKTRNNLDEVTNIDSLLSTYTQNSKKQIESSHVLNEVVIKGNRPDMVPHEDYSNLRGLSISPDQVLNEDRLKNCSFSIVDCILSKAFSLTKVDDNFYIKRAYDAGNKKPVQFFVNGLGIDYGYLFSMRTEDIETIEVFLTDGVSGINRLYDCNGIVSITTKSHSFTPKEKTNGLPSATLQSNTITFTPKGFYKARVFYSPKYAVVQQDVQIIDLRTTIYWNPGVLTDKAGNATFEYYNADGRGTYRAVIEGIDNDGNIGRYIFRYKVR
ncbi:TonB-dependent receptor plug domain-containing protein [soil metagenome]|jgi:hypothetical protein